MESLAYTFIQMLHDDPRSEPWEGAKVPVEASTTQRELICYVEKMSFSRSDNLLPRYAVVQRYLRACLDLNFKEEPNYHKLTQIFKKEHPD